ncbi:ribonuclease III [Tannockella kyphosi]|uniref:ribonuclease III n=1 Tax=Tannockella kyphosi TaxID=2899121 RepID=UPI002010DE85|nr:ribonuclease III [Tannockella kyphosi]
MEISVLLNKLGIPYKDIHLYVEAFTHPSYSNERGHGMHDYERLEFLGDAVLQYYVSVYLFDLYKDIPEGQLTTLRSKLVREESLARFARELDLGPCILLGTGEKNSGGDNRDSVLANVFEAFMGAINLDCGQVEVLKILDRTIYSHVTDIHYDNITDYKTTLQELVQADSRKTVNYQLLSCIGPSNAPVFNVAVKMDEMILGEGTGTSKKKAEQQAAKSALEKMAR